MSRFSVTLPDSLTVQVGFHHKRPENPTDQVILLGGQWYNGATLCEITMPYENRKDRIILASAFTTCALCDNFSRKTGRLIAFRRAVDNFTKDDRSKRALWNAFHKWERDNRRRGEEAALAALALKGRSANV